MAITLPDGYSYVLLVASASTFLGAAHMVVTSQFRKNAQVPYPNAYATAVETASSPEKYRFNCAQRAHAQFLEHYPIFLATMGIAGLARPELAAGMGASWIVARAMYLAGYVRTTNNANGRGRYLGGWYQIPQLGLMGLSLWTSVQLAMK